MILEICAIVFTAVFCLISVYIILTLQSVRTTLKNLDRISLDVEEKLQDLDSSVNTISLIGDACERQLCRSARQIAPPATDSQARDIAEWIVLSFKIGEKFFNK